MMNLFNHEPIVNLLPYDGTVSYHGRIMRPELSRDYFDTLLNKIPWKNDEARIFGRHIITKRKVAWYGDDNYSYTYSNTTRNSLPWTNALLELKALAEKLSGAKFNSCLLNLYHNGEEGMAWHSDDEKALGKDTAIASMSFGAERKFALKHKKTKETVSVVLETGSLLIMKDTTQTNWLHSLPKTKKINTPRINLTFRSYIDY